MRGVLALLLAAAAVLGPGGPAAADATERPSPTPTQAEVAEVPDEVATWFVEQGTEAAAELGNPDDLAVGAPRQVATWNEAYVAGEQEVPTEPLGQWIAPVVLLTTEVPEPAGVVRAGAADGAGLGLLEVIADPELAAALYSVPGGATFVYDDAVEGWFGHVDGEVWPLTENARTVLQGALSTDVFRELLAAWRGQSPATPGPVPTEQPGGALSPLVPIGVIVVLGAGAAWLLLRQYRRADSRIAADVHAGITPPRADGEPARHGATRYEGGATRDGATRDEGGATRDEATRDGGGATRDGG